MLQHTKVHVHLFNDPFNSLALKRVASNEIFTLYIIFMTIRDPFSIFRLKKTWIPYKIQRNGSYYFVAPDPLMHKKYRLPIIFAYERRENSSTTLRPLLSTLPLNSSCLFFVSILSIISCTLSPKINLFVALRSLTELNRS